MEEDGIQFGDVQFDQPDVEIRPDQDGHYAIEVCGMLPENDLPIFVDLDVMRDMEAHAQSDKTVELGGVLLGRQSLDDEGNPYVVVTDWLQADHYESTQSRFKFTHETWADITQRRGSYPKDTEMVGWYHTHPGWGIFLSDMDMFICKNFFNRPLDVALVIDPCKQTRGWFQWTDDSGQKTREVTGFYLMTNRHRESELEYFADLYNGAISMSDPRYSEPSRQRGSSAPIINVADQRNPMFDIAVLGMLAMQFILLSLIAWQMMSTPQFEPNNSGDVIAQQQFEYQQEGYRQALLDIVDPAGGEADRLAKLLDQFDKTQAENQQLAFNQQAQQAYAQQLKSSTDQLNQALADTKTAKSKLQTDYDETRKQLNEKVERVKKLEKSIEAGVDPDASIWAFDLAGNWWWATLASILACVCGVAGALYYTRWAAEQDTFDENDSNQVAEDSSSTSDENINFS